MAIEKAVQWVAFADCCSYSESVDNVSKAEALKEFRRSGFEICKDGYVRCDVHRQTKRKVNNG